MVASRSRKMGVACTAATVTGSMVMPVSAPDLGPDRQKSSGDLRRASGEVARLGNVADRGTGFHEFVGRDGPKQRLLSAYREVVTGPARLVLVSGEAGIGKTTLVAEAIRMMDDGGPLSAWGVCWDADRAPGYWPWTQVLREVVRGSE